MSKVSLFILGLSLFLSMSVNAQRSDFETVIKESASMYNSFSSLNEVSKILAINATASDKEFLNKLTFDSYPKVKVQGKNLFFDGVKSPIEIVYAKNGFYFSVNGTPIKFETQKSISKTINEIQASLAIKYSVFNLLIPQANANAIAIVPAALGIYALGTIVTSIGCYKSSSGLADISDINIKPLVGIACAGIGLTWPYQLYKMFAGMNADRITGGECGEKNKENQTIKLSLKKTDDNKPVELKISDTTGRFYVVKRKPSGEVLSEIEAPDWLFGPDKVKAINFVGQLKQICDAGGTKALNETIKRTVQIQDGLKNLKSGKSDQSTTSDGSATRK